jgi:hypothetical protein
MNFEDFEKIIDRLKTQPKKTIMIVIGLVIIAIAITYGRAFFSAKAIQHANPSNHDQKSQSESATTPNIQTSSDKVNGSTTLEQHTKGDQSPAIITNKDVKIIYKGDK